MNGAQKATGPDRANDQPRQDQNIHATIFAPDEKTGKHLANLQAQLALKGFAVHEVSTGGYFVAKWNLTKFCPALADLESFALQVGA